MATVNNTLTLSSTDLTSDSISLSILNTITSATQGGISRLKLATTAALNATIVAPSAKFTEGAKVWLYNPSTVTGGNERIYVALDAATGQIQLNSGDWAVVPWKGGTRSTPTNITAWGQVADNVLEFGVFQ